MLPQNSEEEIQSRIQYPDPVSSSRKKPKWSTICKTFLMAFHRILLIGISIACITLASLSYGPTTAAEIYFLTVFVILLIMESLVPSIYFHLWHNADRDYTFCIITQYLLVSVGFAIIELSAGLLYPVGVYEESGPSAKRAQRQAAMILAFVNSALHVLPLFTFVGAVVCSD